MNGNKEEALVQLRDLGSSLGQLLDRLGRIEAELAEVKSQAGAQIGSMKSFLESDQVARMSGPEAAPGAELSLANEAIQKLSVAETQEQILEIFLKETESCVERAVLFLEKEGQYSPWKSMGFPSEGIESLALGDSEDPVVRAASQKQIIYRADGVAESFPWLSQAGAIPGAAVCVPLVFEDVAPVLFYGDSSQPINLDSLELLTHLTVLVLKNHYLETALASAAEARAELEAAAAASAAAAPEAPEVPSPETAGPPPVAPPEEREEAPPEPAERAAEPPSQPEVAMPPEPTPAPPEPMDESAEPDEFLSQISKAEATQAAPEPATPEPIPADAQHAVAPEAPAPEETAEPAAAPEPEPPPPGVSPDELERHNNEAKRFARLLVSEIKLYNEEAVEEGRASSDIYGRLQRDIDRSREMYEKRAHPAVRAREDHFHAELVRILARGQESLLGPSYSGPRLS